MSWLILLTSSGLAAGFTIGFACGFGWTPEVSGGLLLALWWTPALSMPVLVLAAGVIAQRLQLILHLNDLEEDMRELTESRAELAVEVLRLRFAVGTTTMVASYTENTCRGDDTPESVNDLMLRVVGRSCSRRSQGEQPWAEVI